MSHLFVFILLLLPFSSISTAAQGCSEGRSRLDSVAFLACQQHHLARLHRMGIWITRSLDPNWQKPSDGLSVCEYMDLLNSSCLSLYSNCTLAREAVRETWVRQAVADTELYGSFGEMLTCESTSQNLNSTEVGAISQMLEENYWRQDSGNCQYLLHYQAIGLPLPVYNHNLDKILRCDEKCDPERLLPQPFPLFEEERAHINSQMNSTIVTYSQCLTDVGIISPLLEETLNHTGGNHARASLPSLQANLSTADWSNSSDIKWRTCASLKTFIRNCTVAMNSCLSEERAEVVLTRDFARMLDLVKVGIAQNRGKVFKDFEHTDCDIFGGDVSAGPNLISTTNQWWLMIALFSLCLIPCKVC